ncbi:putative major facilitator superfamily transporter [Achaetomium macrosporum]|uniref:Major facilitator superfamily transporter n=1 Tax=Achaetomium macrosporum TaxID=79813 RepID=A0AAN7CBK8_9PEZI|nr:putative major facilitator superfamily transporter [Achaetomium macrosporum]
MEPQDRHKSLAAATVRASRRLTIIDLSGVRNSLYATAAAGVQLISVDPQYDPERYHDDVPVPTRQSRANHFPQGGYYQPSWQKQYVSPTIPLDGGLKGEQQQIPPNPFDDVYRVGSPVNEKQNPFRDDDAVLPATVGQDPTPPAPKTEEAYHVFSKSRKRLLIGIIGVAGLFSGLSSNIYFPSLDAIARDLNVSLDVVSLTITSYLIIQGVSPLFWGSLSDTVGRRPIYIASFMVYIISNIALSFSPNFAVLLIFRGLQAAGSASTVSIGNGVIQDISPPAERGAFISFYQAIRNFSIVIGPVLGGLLANFFGFRSIFIFLVTLSSLVIIMIIVFLPETLRSIAGNGSLRLTGIHQPLIGRFTKEPPHMQDPGDTVQRKKVTLMTFIEPLKLLAEKDILLNLLFGGVVYAIWSMVTSSTTGLFKSRFGLSELLLGLAFLPNGFGTIVGSTIAGKLMTRDYKAAEVAYKIANNLPPTHKLSAKNVPTDFPIEYARLRNLPWIVGLFAASTAAYGFSLADTTWTSKPGWIVIPLVLQFLIAATSNAVFALNQTLVSDLCPGKGASSTAINNLVRCGLGAIGVAFVETMVADIGPAPAFLGLALIMVAMSPFVVVNWYWGREWRAARMEKKVRLEEKKNVQEA